VHGDIPEAYSAFYSAVAKHAALVSISAAQRRSGPELPWTGTVHNAVDVGRLVVTPTDKEPYLLSLARVCPDKGQHIAIDVARRTGFRLVLAGKVESTPRSISYFERCVEPFIDSDCVVHFDNVAREVKARLLSRAYALLAPLQWDEPFGLAMVEAMASGTPVIALARGAAPELVTVGVTGFLANDADEMARVVPLAAEVDPWLCAEAARARFSPSAMAEAYLRMYESVGSNPALQPGLARLADAREGVAALSQLTPVSSIQPR
jgi:glycosyltransferase involved in cell wall biosynthesis